MLKNSKFRFLPAEKFTFFYILLSSFLILIFKNDMQTATKLLEFRFIIILGICFFAFIDSFERIWILRFLRYIYLAILLSYWYPETFEINKTLHNLDFLLADIEHYIFGCQPALIFDAKFSQHWISELMNMGYISYYPLIVLTGLYFYFKDSSYFKIFFFSIIFSFYLYYLIFIIFPTVGPQYYYSVNGIQDVGKGIFHHIGDYFLTNNVVIGHPANNGFFQNLVETTQQVGERPTAAFPSSHVGISTLIMIHIFKKRYFIVFSFITPIYLALLASTVYIKAHYIIDVLAGLLTAFLFFYLSVWIYKKFFQIECEQSIESNC